MKTRIVVTLLVAFAVLGAIFGYKYLTIRKAMAAYALMRPVPVTVAGGPSPAPSAALPSRNIE